jgi:1,4-alpha-glucan branching enzyme
MQQGAEKFGFNVDSNNNIVYREWAPNATAAFLIGDFSKYFKLKCSTMRLHCY